MRAQWDAPLQAVAEFVLQHEPDSAAKRERLAWLVRSLHQAVSDWLDDNPSLEEEITN